MSLYYMANGEAEVLVYKDGRTKQTFKDETDINKILGRFKKTGVISHMSKYEGSYGEFEEFDFLETKVMLREGEEIFAALPGEVRREFGQDPGRFFEFVNDPKNKDRLKDVLPAIAQKGDYFNDVSRRTPPGELVEGGEPGGRRASDVTSKIEKGSVQGEKDAD